MRCAECLKQHFMSEDVLHALAELVWTLLQLHFLP